MELLHLALEARGEAVCDALFLLRPRLGVAVEPRLSSFGVDRLVDMDRLARPGLDGQRQLGIEAAGAFPADRQIAVAVRAQPGDVGLGGDPRVHHHQRVRRRAQGAEHRRQGPVFVDRAREHLGAAHEARAVEHQPQGQERAIRALLLGMAAFGLGLGRRRALEEGVGQVVQRHRAAQAEQIRRPIEQMRLDRRALRHQGVGGAVQAHHAHALEVHPQQLAERRTLAQPAPGGALRARRRHAGDHGGHGERALRAVEAQALQQSLQAEPLHGPQPDMLDADRTRADQLQGADIHRLQVRAPGPAGRRAVEQLRGDALGVPLDLLRTGQRNQLGLAVELLLDPAAQHRPVPPLDREVAPQVEQGALADLPAVALRANKAMGIIDLAALAGSGPGAANEHGAQHRSGRKVSKSPSENIMALHCAPGNLNPAISTA